MCRGDAGTYTGLSLSLSLSLSVSGQCGSYWAAFQRHEISSVEELVLLMQQEGNLRNVPE